MRGTPGTPASDIAPRAGERRHTSALGAIFVGKLKKRPFGAEAGYPASASALLVRTRHLIAARAVCTALTVGRPKARVYPLEFQRVQFALRSRGEARKRKTVPGRKAFALPSRGQARPEEEAEPFARRARARRKAA